MNPAEIMIQIIETVLRQIKRPPGVLVHRPFTMPDHRVVVLEVHWQRTDGWGEYNPIRFETFDVGTLSNKALIELVKAKIRRTFRMITDTWSPKKGTRRG